MKAGWQRFRSPRALRLGALFAALTMTSASGVGDGLLSAALAQAQQAVDYIALRSPGERTRAIMGKGKGRYTFEKTRVARALPRVRTPPEFLSLPLVPGPVELAALAPPVVESVPAVAGVLPTGGAIFAREAPFFIFGPGLGGGGGGGGGVIITTPEEPGPPTPPPPPVDAIPEPAAWMTMIVGFGMLGAMQRRKAHAKPRRA